MHIFVKPHSIAFLSFNNQGDRVHLCHIWTVCRNSSSKQVPSLEKGSVQTCKSLLTLNKEFKPCYQHFVEARKHKLCENDIRRPVIRRTRTETFPESSLRQFKMIHIRMKGQNLNRDTGLELDTVWDNLLRPNRIRGRNCASVSMTSSSNAMSSEVAQQL